MEVLNQQSPIVIVKSTDNDITLKYKHASHPKKKEISVQQNVLGPNLRFAHTKISGI